MHATTLQEYLTDYGALVADRARQAFEPLHVPSTDAAIELDLRRPMLDAQAHVVTAMVKCLNKQKAVFCSAECGTGKTQMGICAVHAHAKGKPYRAIAMVPPHLIATWQQELSAIFHPRTIDTWVLDSWSELPMLPTGKLRRPLWLIASETTMKMGPSWRPAVITDRDGILHCPDCGAPVRAKNDNGEGNLLTLKDLEKSRKRCSAEICDGETTRTCGAALWQYDNTDHCWAPCDYISKQMRGVFDYLVCDEVHQMKSENSARGVAMSMLAASVKKVIGMTGTLIGGKASHVRSLLFRLSAQSLRAEYLTWEDGLEFSRRFGRVDTVITERESSSDNRRSRGKQRTKREQEAPGILPQLYAQHLLDKCVFLSLRDVAANLPEYVEHPTPIAMNAEQSAHYEMIEDKLKKAIKDLLRKGNKQLLGPMLHCLLAWIDLPYGWDPIGYVDRKDGPHGRYVHVVQPPELDPGIVWPKEQALLNILTKARAAGRQCWTFVSYTDKHDMLARLEMVAQRAGFRAKVLRADKVPTKGRSTWIDKNAPGCDVMLSHAQPVSLGLTLFSADGRHNFPEICFFETGYNPFDLMQASRRAWRIGQRERCAVHFLYYSMTMQQRAMQLMSQKIAASKALEGQLSTEGLAAMCGEGGSLAMELARSLADNIPFTEIERTWTRIGGPELTLAQ